MAFLFRLGLFTSILVLLLLVKTASAQYYYIVVHNKNSHSALPNAIYTSTITGHVFPSQENGMIQLPLTETQGVISHIGYEAQRMNLDSITEDTVYIYLTPTSSILKTVNISNKRYQNRNNPAVELIKRVREHKKEHQPKTDYEYFSYQKYEKLSTGVMLKSTEIPKVPLLPSLNVFFDNFDTTKVKGMNLYPILLEENVFLNYFQNTPRKHNEIHLGNKQIRFNDRYINNDHATQSLRFLYDNLDVYQSSIPLFSREIISPIHTLGPQFYKYYLGDTLMIETQNPIVQLFFEPRNEQDPLFNGLLHIRLSDYSIAEAEINLSEHANINFISEAKIKLYYQKTQEGYQIDESYSFTKLSLLDNAMQGYLERSVILDHLNFEGPFPDSVYTLKTHTDSVKKDYDIDFWEQNRPIALSEAETAHYETYDSISKLKFFKRLQDWGSFLFSGYKQVGHWEVGNINNLVNYNEVEGLKLSIHFRTTPRWSPSWYLNTQFSYGFKDEKLKHRWTLIKSFSGEKGVFNFPHNYIMVNYFNDIRFPGQTMSISDQSNILHILRSEAANRILYNQKYHLSYVRDWNHSFKTQIGIQHTVESPGGILAQLPDHELSFLHYQYSSIMTQLTWAPGQEIIQQKDQRRILPNTHPVFRFDLEWAPEELAWNQYPFLSADFNLFKRTYLGPFGKLDGEITLGKTWGDLPYTLMYTPSTNTSYLFDKNSFNLLNYSEFIADQYIKIKAEWQLDGLIFNKIPYLKYLRFREVVGIHAMAGQLSNHNNPALHTHLPSLPLDENNQVFIYPFEWQKPYLELNIGITNILKVLRIDLISRLTHRREEKQLNTGIKASIHIAL